MWEEWVYILLRDGMGELVEEDVFQEVLEEEVVVLQIFGIRAIL